MDEHAAGATRQWFGGRPAVTTLLCVARPLRCCASVGLVGQGLSVHGVRVDGGEDDALLAATNIEGLSLRALLSRRRRRGFDLY